jgi:hypothetical protein
MDHTKPTPEELNANIEKAQQEIEQLKEPHEETRDDKNESVQEESQNSGDEKSEERDEEQHEEKIESTDYKKRYIESTREAQILAAKNRKLSEAFDEAGQVTEPTEEELKQEYADWEEMSESQRKLARKTLISDRRFSAINKVTQEFKDIDAWQSKVKTFIEDPKTLIDNPLLEGKVEEFQAFASKPTRRGVDFEDIVSAFLYEDSRSKTKHKGKMMETGSGGAKEKQKKPGMLSVEEGRKLRTSNYSKWTELLRAGKIEQF